MGISQPINRKLDQSVSLPICGIEDSNPGVDLQTNGTFDSDVSGWTAAGSTLSWDSGKARISRNSTAGNTGLYQAFVKPSNQVRIKGDIVLVSGGPTSGQFRVRNRYGTVKDTGLTGSGSFNVIMDVNGATNEFELYVYAANIVYTLDNLRIIDEG